MDSIVPVPAPVPVAAIPGEETPIRPFGFWLTLLFGVLSFVLALILAIALISGIDGVARMLNLLPMRWWMAGIDEGMIGFALQALLVVLLLIPLIRRRGGVRNYFALRLPNWKEALLGLALFALVSGGADLYFTWNDIDPITPWQRDLFSRCQLPGLLFLLPVLVLLAPLWEEGLFRGFLFRGWTASVGAPLATLLTAATWASLHLQYELVYVLTIFAYGLVLGYIRHRSGSLLLCMALHALNNLVSYALTYDAVFGNPLSNHM